jgi:hypothetical protein
VSLYLEEIWLSCLNKYVKKALIHLYCSPGVEGEVRWPPLLPSLRLPPSAGFGNDSFSSESVSPCSRPSRTLKNIWKEFMQTFLLVLRNYFDEVIQHLFTIVLVK